MESITSEHILFLPTLRQLEYVVAVADTGQFVEAARRCAVSQPALSKQVREVEDLLGVEIFERARPRVIVTDAGRTVVARARQLISDARELVRSARGQQKLVRLGVIPTIAPYGLPGLLAKLRMLFEDVSYSIHELQTEVLLEQLRAGDIDIGLLARPFDDHGLEGPDLVFEPFVFVAPEGHALDAKKGIRTSDIIGQSLILMADGHCLRDQAIDVCAVAGAPPPTSVTAASVSTLTRMVESGLGATLLPASALRAEVRPQQGLIARSFSPPMPGRTLTLQWRTTSANRAWYGQIAKTLRAHYLSMNEDIPKVRGPKPKLRSVKPS